MLNRLKLCSEMVTGKGIACDVGTDHAYLAADLILSNKCSQVIASDIKEGPLEAAAKTVEKYGLSDKIQLVLSDGLQNVPDEGVSDVIIAGMGGETIVEILQACCWIADESINLVLQPMTKAEILREWLGMNGFEIDEERAVEETGRVYIVIRAHYNECGFPVSELSCLRGDVDAQDPAGAKYLANQAHALRKKADALDAAGRIRQAHHYRTLADNLTSEADDVSIAEIYDFLDSRYPFSTQEKWDNSGFLVEKYGQAERVLLTLDIDINSIEEARMRGADLIISHHPVIFEPLKRITTFSPVMELIKANLGAICLHTNLDKSPDGTNGVILRKISERFALEGEPEIFESCGDGLGYGYIAELKNSVSAEEFGMALRDIFGCSVVKMNKRNIGYVKRFAFCSGSGGSMLDIAVNSGCDAYITGDVKHDVWIDANNKCITLYDCGHFNTENIVLEELRYTLEKQFPQLEVIIADSSSDPVLYI